MSLKGKVMSVRKKLMLSFLVITGLVVISGIVGFTSLNTIDEKVERMADEKIPQNAIVSSSVLEMEKIISNLKTYAMSYKSSIDEVNLVYTKLDKLIKELKKLNSRKTKNIIKQVSTLKEMVKELVSIHNQKVDLYFIHKAQNQEFIGKDLISR